MPYANVETSSYKKLCKGVGEPMCTESNASNTDSSHCMPYAEADGSMRLRLRSSDSNSKFTKSRVNIIRLKRANLKVGDPDPKQQKFFSSEINSRFMESSADMEGFGHVTPYTRGVEPDLMRLRSRMDKPM
jgi:hypothetical protein